LVKPERGLGGLRGRDEGWGERSVRVAARELVGDDMACRPENRPAQKVAKIGWPSRISPKIRLRETSIASEVGVLVRGIALTGARVRWLDGLAAIGGGAAFPLLPVGFFKPGDVVGIGLDGGAARARGFSGWR
jgi:hypothetical protein